jgi:hypothetical protein
LPSSFDIVLSRLLSTDDLAAALGELAPAGLRVDVRSDIDELVESTGVLRALVGSSDDPAWPCVVVVFGCGDEFCLGSFPDLRVASHLSERLEVDALCGTYPFVGPLDPHDPYWFLASIKGRWYLASTVDTRLMDERGQRAIELVREIQIPAD